MTWGLTFLSLMSAYWWKNYILNFKKLISLTLRGTFKRPPKVLSNQNLLSRFQSWCWFWCWSCLNFVQKNYAVWLVLKILGPQRILLQPGWVSAPLISQKVTKSPPTPFPQQIFTFTKSLHYYNLKLEIKEWKEKMVIKIFNNKSELS